MQPGPDARVLSYHDVLLRRADLDLLRGPEWLNDQVQLTAWQCHPGVTSLEVQTDRTPHVTHPAAVALLLHLFDGGPAPKPGQQCVPDAARQYIPAAQLW